MNKKLIIVLIGVFILILFAVTGEKDQKITQPVPITVKTKTKPQKTKQSAFQKIKNIVVPGEKQKSLEEAKRLEETRLAEIKAQKAKQRALENANLTPDEKRQKIVNLTVQARTKLKKGKYLEVIDMAEELLSLDPDHKEAKVLIERANKAKLGTQ